MKSDVIVVNKDGTGFTAAIEGAKKASKYEGL